MKALLSIKPEFANKIFDGSKHFEYRRIIFKRPVKHIVVYASAPVGKVIGEFEIDGLLYEDLDSLWSKTKNHSGISECFFYEYFSERSKGYAIKVGKTVRYRKSKSLSAEFGIKPPQSFVYL